MKIIIVLLTAVFLQQGYAANAQGITINKEHTTLRQILKEIRQQSGYDFFFEEATLEGVKPVNIVIRNGSLEEVLEHSFRDQPLTYSISGKTIVVKKSPLRHETRARAPIVPIQQTVTGRVTDAEGRALTGVSVSIKGTVTGSTTDAEGRYSLQVNPGEMLVFSYVGYISQEIAYTGQPSISITLQADNTNIDEVVVIGYGTQRRSEITGAIASVSGESIATVGSSDVQEALQGRIAGVDISPSTGQPGAPLDMNIRGVATIGNGNPLFVIDGVPIMSEGGSRIFNPLASINPKDIQSIQVLKDASAAAIYGSRAANGVVIIMTNRGNAGSNSIKFHSSVGFSEVADFVSMMNSAQYAAYATEAFQNGGRAVPVSLQEPLLSRNLQRNTDWQRELFRNGTSQNYWGGISGGNTNANYSFTSGYTDQGGTLPNSGFKRFSTRINSDFKLGERIRIGESIELSRNNWTGTFDPTSPMMNQLLMSSPTVPVYKADADGGFDGPRLEYSPVGRANSIGLLTLTDNERSMNKFTGNAYFEFEPLRGLKNRTNVGAEITFAKQSTFTPTYDMGDYVNALATLAETRDNENVYLIENITTYQYTLNDTHQFNFLLGFTHQQSWRENLGVQLRGFQSNDLRTVAAGFENRNIDGLETGWKLRSQMARLSYSYRDKYNLMAVVRRDGSSRFGINNRYGIFPSISGSWNIKRESFLEGYEPLSNLTLRASYGQVGSQNLSDFAQYAVIEQGMDYFFGPDEARQPGATYLIMGNNDLKWEVTTQTNVGLDFSFLNNRLSFVADYYIKNTDGVLLQLPIPTTSGIQRLNGPFVNAGSLENSGFEFAVNYQNALTDVFGYDISFNIATNKNRVTGLGTQDAIISQWTRGKQYATTITTENEEVGSFYGYIMEGIFRDIDDLNAHAAQPGSAPGDVKFKDLDNNGEINASDQTIIGSPFPDFTYGINAGLRYKQFDLSLFIQGKQGQEIYNLLAPSINDGEGDNNATIVMLDRWTPDNRDTRVPRAVSGNPGQNTRPSTRFIEDGSYLRIQNVQIGYNFAIERFHLTQSRVYLSARNLYTFTKYTGYNPEIGTLFEGDRSSLIRNMDNASYPIPRTIELGIQLNF